MLIVGHSAIYVVILLSSVVVGGKAVNVPRLATEGASQSEGSH